MHPSSRGATPLALPNSHTQASPPVVPRGRYEYAADPLRYLCHPRKVIGKLGQQANSHPLARPSSPPRGATWQVIAKLGQLGLIAQAVLPSAPPPTSPLSVTAAPEPDEVLWTNLEVSSEVRAPLSADLR